MFDLEDDFDIIESSFLSCYGIRLRRELNTMSSNEFLNLLINLDGDTPFKKAIQVRGTDKSKLPDYLQEEKTRQNRIMFQRGYFDSSGDISDLKSIMLAMSM